MDVSQTHDLAIETLNIFHRKKSSWVEFSCHLAAGLRLRHILEARAGRTLEEKLLNRSQDWDPLPDIPILLAQVDMPDVAAPTG